MTAILFRLCTEYTFFFKFPLQSFATSGFVVQNTALFHYKYAERYFIIFDGVSRINKICANLQHSTSMKNIEEGTAIKDVSSLSINNKYLTHHQSCTKTEILKKEKKVINH